MLSLVEHKKLYNLRTPSPFDVISLYDLVISGMFTSSLTLQHVIIVFWRLSFVLCLYFSSIILVRLMNLSKQNSS